MGNDGLHFVARSPRKLFAALAALAISLLLACRCAGDVVIVKTSDAEPYNQAEETLRDRLTAPNVNIRTVLVKSLADDGISGSIATTDTVIAIGTPAAAWLHNQLPEGVELVYCMVSNARDAGLLKGAPCWGITMDLPPADQFKVIAEAMPHTRKLGALYRSDIPAEKDLLDSLRKSLPSGWEIDAVDVAGHATVADAIDELTQKDIDLILTWPDAKLYDSASIRELLLSAIRNNIPVWGFSPQFVRAGALFGAGVDPHAQANQTADLIKELAISKSGHDLVQSPKEYQIAVNLNVADQLRIDLPDSLVKRATYVFKEEK
ncbi:MAG: ABC transporter substrate binding protein [Tepidisphaeraceae bacterium]|jgi:ABC-type uncharacterized transport system substrate-binding protein